MTNKSERLPGFIRTASTQWDSSWPELATVSERHRLFSYLEARFGIPERLFDGYELFKRKKSWRMLKKDIPVTYAAHLKVFRIGIKAFQQVGAFVKPTTRMIQIFGGEATKARLEITEGQLKSLLAGNAIAVALALEQGYLILTLGENRILGLGFYANGQVHSQIPRKELRQSMLFFAR